MDNSEAKDVKVAEAGDKSARRELSSHSSDADALKLFSSFESDNSGAAKQLPDTSITRSDSSAGTYLKFSPLDHEPTIKAAETTTISTGDGLADLSLFQSFEAEKEKPTELPPKFNWDPDFKVIKREGDERVGPHEIPKTGDRLTDTVNTIKDIPEKHKQMVVVTTANKGSTTGELRIYQRDAEIGWVDSGERIPINVGRNGLNWGVRNDELLDTHDLSDRRKVEGDGTGPIGLFTIPGAFGLKSQPAIYDQLSQYGAKDSLPYRQIKPGSQWTGTRNNYNSWIEGGPKSRGNEDLYSIARSGLYEYGLVLGYNGADMFNGQSTTGYQVQEAQYKGGSAIFVHVERGPGRPTAGCTSMSRENMLKVMAALNHGDNPLWLQIPRSELDKLENRRFIK